MASPHLLAGGAGRSIVSTAQVSRCGAGPTGRAAVVVRSRVAATLGQQGWGRSRRRLQAGQEEAGLPSRRLQCEAMPVVNCLVSLSTVYCLPFFILMAAAPRLKWLRDMMETPWFVVPVALVYLVLLTQSWEPDTISLMMPGDLQEGLATGKPQFFPQLSGIGKLFSRSVTAASLWVHLLCINLVAARHIYLDGIRSSITTRHSILCSALMGPLGLMSHVVTKALVRNMLRSSSDEDTPEPTAAPAAS